MSAKTGYSVRIVHGTAHGAAVTRLDNGRWSLATFASTAADARLPGDLIQDMARNPARVMWVPPEDQTSHAVMTLPRLKDKDLENAVRGWIAREEGGAPEDWNIAWQAMPVFTDQKNESRQRVCALYAKGSGLLENLNAQEGLAPAPRHALPGSMVLDQFYRLTGDGPAVDGVWNLVFLSREDNFLVVSSPDCLLLTRGLPNDLSGGDDLEQYLERLSTEIQRSSFFIRQGDHSPEVDRIIVTGDPTLASRLVARLAQDDGVPAHYWDMAENFDLGGRSLDADLLVSLAAAALSLEKLPYDLMPRPHRKLFGPKLRRRALVAAGSLAVALLPILMIGSVVTAKVQEGYLKRALQRLDVARFDAEKAAEVYKSQRLMLSRQTHLLSFQAQRPDLEAVLLQLGRLVPPEVKFRDLRIRELEDGTTRLTLTGESVAPTSARAQEAFLKFQAALEGTDFLRGSGEPLKLEISGSHTSGQTLRKTVFKMDFELVTEGKG